MAVTGGMNGPLTGLRRQDALRLLREAGAATAGSVSGRTTLLVASRQPTRKSLQAAKLGVKVICPGELADCSAIPLCFSRGTTRVLASQSAVIGCADNPLALPGVAPQA